MPHAAAITKEVFLQMVERRRELRYRKTNNYARCHEMNPEWSEIMGRKIWNSTSEMDGRASASAWHWLTTKSPQEPYDIALLSRWILPGIIFRKLGAGYVWWASLGRGKWSTLSWPINASRNDAGEFVLDFARGQDREKRNPMLYFQ